MFTINISFKDALTCFETLSHIKPDEELQSIESEFVKYAQKRARVGDSAAQTWLKDNTVIFEEDFTDSPLCYFVDKERPAEKDAELAELAKREARGEIKDKKELPPLTKEQIEEALRPLEELIGLGGVKQHIRRILETRLIDQRREKAGLKTMSASANHMVFTGSPGTGKTTVARLIAGIFRETGLLSRGHLTEVSRGDLVGEYIGQTEQIMKDVLQDAKGGVLFIDEAHALHRVFYATTDFGVEAINALIKYMEDNRDDLIIIFAGYEDHMGSFLRSNPGLKSRIPHHLHFDDMKEDQLMTIFKSLCQEHDYNLDEKAEKALLLLMKDFKRKEGSEFPNARGVRNLFEEVIRRQSERLLKQDIEEAEQLKLIEEEDIPLKKPSSDGNVVRLPRN